MVHETAARRRTSRRRTLGLIGLTAGVFVTVLDATVLTVAIPTLQRDLHTDLAALEWVIALYGLVFAALLIPAGRLGDVVGHRRVVVAGLGFFAAGSLMTALSHAVGPVLVGEGVLEGIGAAMMGSSSLSLISDQFKGPERNRAFALYGVMGGTAGAFGPVIGGWLTTDLSWRWAFAINVALAPVLAALVLAGIAEERAEGARPRFDAAGVVTATGAVLLLVFAFLEAPRYGWWKALRPLTVSGRTVIGGGVSAVVWSLVAGAVLLGAFWRIERAKDRRGADALYPFSRLQFPSFQNGIVTQAVLSVGEFSMFFVLAVVLQQQKHLTALRTGVWVLPFGLTMIVGAAIGAALTSTLGPKRTVVAGMALEAAGLAWMAWVIGPAMTIVGMAPAVLTYGIGAGFATAQLSNLVMAEIPPALTGVASGVNNTMRQVGAALGIALVGSALSLGPRQAVAVTAVAVLLGAVTAARIPSDKAPAPGETGAMHNETAVAVQ